MLYEVAARSRIGGREKQDDSWSVTADDGSDLSNYAVSDAGASIVRDGLVLVADGLGGLGGGHAASAIVAKTLPRAYFERRDEGPIDNFRRALTVARGAVSEAQAQTPGGENMATTVIAGYVENGGLHYMSVGDSHLYRFRQGELHILNPKHAYGAELDVQAFVSGRDEAWGHAFAQSQREALTAAVGVDPSREPEFGYTRVERGDIFLLASDGLDAIPTEQLRRFVDALAEQSTLADLVERLVDATDRYGRAFFGGRHDNVTVLALRERRGGDDEITIRTR